MKTPSKLLVATTIIIVYLIFVGFYAYNALESKKERIYVELSHKLTNELNNEKKYLQEIGIINASFIAEYKDIKQALIDNDRVPAIKILQKISKDFAKSTNIKDMKIHIHTADTKAFIRSWKLNKFGDDLSGFRKAIVKVKENREPFFGFEVGRMGLTLRSIVPIMEQKKFLGSLEFIQNFENIIKTFKKKDYGYLLLMDNSLISIAKYLQNAPMIDSYRVSSKNYDTKFLNASKTVDFKRLKQDGYYLSDKYFYTYEEIKNADNKDQGMHLLAMPNANVQTAIQNAKNDLLQNIATKSLFLLLLFVIFALVTVLISSSRTTR